MEMEYKLTVNGNLLMAKWKRMMAKGNGQIVNGIG